MTIAFYSLIGFLLFVYFEPSLFLPMVGELRVALLVACLSMVAAFVSGSRPPRALASKLFICLLLWAAFVTLASPFPYRAENGEYLGYFVKGVALYFLIILVLQSKPILEKFWYLTLGLGWIVAITTFLTHRLGIQNLKGYKTVYRMVNYFGGLGDDPNEFGALMVALFPLPLALLLIEEKASRRILWLGMAATFLLCIVRSRSRGAFVALAVVLAINAWENRKHVLRIGLMAILVAIIFVNTHEGYWERLFTMQSEESLMDEGSARDRAMQLSYAAELLAQFPFTGVGLNNFVPAKIRVLNLDPELKTTLHVVHNAYLELAVETGILGLGIFISILVLSFTGTYSTERKLLNRHDSRVILGMTRGVRHSLAGLAIAIIFLSEQYNLMIYQLVGVSVCLRLVADHLPSLASSHPSPKKMINPYNFSLR